MASYDAVIVGAGPSGLATICSLLDSAPQAQRMRVLWVDRDFEGGRLNQLYREISSNTKVHIYLSAIHSSRTCKDIVARTPSPNAVTRLEAEEGEKTVQLSMAGDMVMMLVRGLLDGPYGVESTKGEVADANLQDDTWHVRLKSGRQVQAVRLFLCTGSHPLRPELHKPHNPSLAVLDLDECLLASHLPSLLPEPPETATVAVIGNSHSGILVVRNLFELAQSGKRKVKVLNFRRGPIKYAEYRDDGIVWDNSGLKGATAEWAKSVLGKGDGKGVVEEIDLAKQDEDATYKEYLPKCTHIVYAIGYEPNTYPDLYLGETKIDQQKLHFDMHTSGFRIGGEDGEEVRGLYGMGIAHPEMVEDPEGHVEAAVGVAKFFKFGERVGERWVNVVSG